MQVLCIIVAKKVKPNSTNIVMSVWSLKFDGTWIFPIYASYCIYVSIIVERDIYYFDLRQNTSSN